MSSQAGFNETTQFDPLRLLKPGLAVNIVQIRK